MRFTQIQTKGYPKQWTDIMILEGLRDRLRLKKPVEIRQLHATLGPQLVPGTYDGCSGKN